MVNFTPVEKGIILNYCVRDLLSYKAIWIKISKGTCFGIEKLCKSAYQYTGCDNIDTILQQTSIAPGYSRKRLVEPGSEESVKIQRKVANKYIDQDLHEAIN